MAKRPAKKKAADLAKQVEELDEFAEYSPMKKELSDRVEALAVDAILAITGDRNYHLEADGSIAMQYGATWAPLAQWNKEQWAYFVEDVKRRNLLARLDALAE